jgi:hypothetical protein
MRPLQLIELTEPIQHFVHCDDILDPVPPGEEFRINFDSLRAFPATLPGAALPRIVQQDLPHHPSGNREKMRTVLPLNFLLTGEAHICLVDHGSGLQGMAGALPAHLDTRDPAKFVVNQRNELTGDIRAAGPELPKERRHIITCFGQLSPFTGIEANFPVHHGFYNNCWGTGANVPECYTSTSRIQAAPSRPGGK